MIDRNTLKRLPIPLLPAFRKLARLRGLDIVPIPPDGTERPIYENLTSEPVDIIFDVGAHHGDVAKRFRESFPHSSVYCFEPTTESFSVLSKNIAALPNVRAYNMAIGSKVENLNISLFHETKRNSISNQGTDREKGQQICAVTTIDVFCKEHNIRKIDLLKLDVEGYEYNVLKGASNMLAESIKFILVECSFRDNDPRYGNFSQIYRFLCDSGFALAGFYETVYRRNMLMEYTNALFIHRER